jgi:hypothetical protein
MARLGIRSGVRTIAVGLVALGATAICATAPPARADVVAYLVNVHMRPGYNFPNADAALSYGYGICDKVSAGRGYPQLIGDVKADFNTFDEFQGLLSDQLSGQRTLPSADLAAASSAAHYQPAPETG